MWLRCIHHHNNGSFNYKQRLLLFTTWSSSSLPINKNLIKERHQNISSRYLNLLLTSTTTTTTTKNIRHSFSTISSSSNNNNNNNNNQSKTPITWPKLIGLLGISFFALGYYLREKEKARQRVMAKNTQVVGKALLGGPWTLLNEQNKEVTHIEVLGNRFGLLYFGFTKCPDICPSEMTKMAQVIDTLDKRNRNGKDQLVPIFISVDSKRDTPEIVGKYVKQYHPKMIGLTGSPDAITKVCKTFRVYHNPTNDDGDGEDYLIDHSIVMYLIASDGEFLDFYTQMAEVNEIVERIEKQIDQYRKDH
jgi:protein SCO1/2